MKINEIERLVGITKRNIRFYEKEGLLCPGRDSQNGYRDYTQKDVDELRKIKLLRKLALPLSDIRAIQCGSLLESSLRRHIDDLERQRGDLLRMQEVCSQIIEGRESYPSMDAGRYLQYIERLEQEGTQFMNVRKRDTRRTGAVAAAAVIAVLMLGVMTLFFWGVTSDPQNAPPVLVTAIFMAVPAAVIVALILALRRRFRELKGGEEDAASQY